MIRRLSCLEGIIEANEIVVRKSEEKVPVRRPRHKLKRGRVLEAKVADSGYKHDDENWHLMKGKEVLL
jgi:hypothetical protein